MRLEVNTLNAIQKTTAHESLAYIYYIIFELQMWCVVCVCVCVYLDYTIIVCNFDSHREKLHDIQQRNRLCSMLQRAAIHWLSFLHFPKQIAPAKLHGKIFFCSVKIKSLNFFQHRAHCILHTYKNLESNSLILVIFQFISDEMQFEILQIWKLKSGCHFDGCVTEIEHVVDQKKELRDIFVLVFCQLCMDSCKF